MLEKIKGMFRKNLQTPATEEQQENNESILEDLKERVREYLKTHKTESQQEYGQLMMKVLSRPNAIPEVSSKPIKVILFTLGYKSKKEIDEAYDKLVKEIKERENKVYTYIDPEKIENY